MPFDPNGMIMGFARSCYDRPMKFVVGDTSLYATVRWYFAKPTALPFPAMHRFGPAIWDTTRGLVTDLGDDATKKMVYSKGQNMNLSDGTSFAGPIEYFTHGAPAPGAIDRLPGGTPVQCVPPWEAIAVSQPRIVKSAMSSVELLPAFKRGIVKACDYLIDT